MQGRSEIHKSLRGNLTSQCQSLQALQLCLCACCIAGAECDIWALGSATREEQGPWQEVTAWDVTILDGKVPGSFSIVLLPPLPMCFYYSVNLCMWHGFRSVVVNCLTFNRYKILSSVKISCFLLPPFCVSYMLGLNGNWSFGQIVFIP